jgi:hypothetical protein
MLYLDIAGTPLLLPATATVDLEHINPLFADGIEEGTSIPMEVPTEGNEATLGHVHELSLRERRLRFQDARLGHQGSPMFPGTLHVLSSVPSSVRMAFVLDGFVEELKGVMLPDTLRGEVIDLYANEWYIPYYIPNYAGGGPCTFPQYYNPDLYGDTNPDWVRPFTTYDASRAYEINDLVEFTDRTGAIERVEVWQCENDTLAGQTPWTHPDKWRKTAFGVVNAWDAEINQPKTNSSAGNFYTLVPWFYLKWILTRSLANIGYRVEGAFMDDTKLNELVIANNTTMDRENSIDLTTYFRVHKPTPTYYDPSVAWQLFHIPGDTESPGPYQDTGNRWDNSAFTFSPTAAGTWTFQFEVRINRLGAQVTRPHLHVHIVNSSGTSVGSGTLLPTWLGDRRNGVPATGVVHTYRGTVRRYFSAGEVGQTFHFAGQQRAVLAAGEVHRWPLYNTDHYVYADVSCWLQTADSEICRPDLFIYPHRHVPNVAVTDLLIALADAFNLEANPDPVTRTLHLNYKEARLREANLLRTDHSPRLINDTEIDHARAINGLRLKWDVQQASDPNGELPLAPEYDHVHALPVPITAGLVSVLTNTREVLRSNFRDGTFCWQRKGYYLPDAVLGDEEDAATITPQVKPVMMTDMTIDLESYVLPVFKEAGTSAWFHITTEFTDIVLAEYKVTRNYSGEATNAPGARSFGYGWDDDDRTEHSFLWRTNDPALPGMYERHWIRWANMLVNAEPVTMDLLLDVPFLRGNDWKNVLHLHGQDYLIERMPVQYGMTHGPLISEGAYAYRLKPTSEQLELIPETPFVCEGPGHVGFTVDGTTDVTFGSSSSGYYAIRYPDTTITALESDEIVYGLTSGSYCLWPSDEEGVFVPSGDIVSFGISGPVNYLYLAGLEGHGTFEEFLIFETNLTNIVLPQVLNLLFIDIAYNTMLSSITLPETHLMNNLSCYGNALSQECIDAILQNLVDNTTDGGAVELSGGTNSPPSAAGLANIAILEDRGWTVTVNT